MADVESRGRKYLRRFLIVCSCTGVAYFAFAFLAMCINFYIAYNEGGLWGAIYFLPHSFPAIILLLCSIISGVLFLKRNRMAVYIFIWALLITPIFFAHDVINNLWVFSFDSMDYSMGNYFYLNWPSYHGRYDNKILRGFIDKTGHYVIKPQFQSVSDFSEGVVAVESNGKYGFIDKSGKYIVEPVYNYAGDFSEGLAWVVIEEKCGFIDKDGELVIEAKFDNAEDFSEGVALVRSQSQEYYIDRNGQTAIVPDVNSLRSFSEGMAEFSVFMEELETTKYGFIDKTGGIAIEARFDSVRDFSNGLAKVKVEDKYGFIDKKGVYVIEPKFSYAKNFSESMAAVEKNDKYGYVNLKGEFVIEPKYDRAGRFIDGLAKVSIGNKHFFIDKSGEIVLEPGGWTNPFSEGLAQTRRGFKYGFINKQGDMAIKPEFKYCRRFSEGLAAVSVLEKEFKTVYAYSLAAGLGLLQIIIYRIIKKRQDSKILPL